MNPKERMTLEDIEKIETEYLIPAQVAAVLGCDPYAINVQARDNPAALGFPMVKLGSRVKIPKVAFLRFMRGELPVTSAGCAECVSDSLYRQVRDGHLYCKSCGRRLSHIKGVEYIC